jgi:hypothetical protein
VPATAAGKPVDDACGREKWREADKNRTVLVREGTSNRMQAWDRGRGVSLSATCRCFQRGAFFRRHDDACGSSLIASILRGVKYIFPFFHRLSTKTCGSSDAMITFRVRSTAKAAVLIADIAINMKRGGGGGLRGQRKGNVAGYGQILKSAGFLL